MSDGNGDQVEAWLRKVVGEADPVPSAVSAAARSAFDLRSLDTDLAELVADSRDSAALVRGVVGRRQLAFAAGSVSLDVEVTGDGARRRLIGIAEGTAGPVTAESSLAGVAPVTVELGDHGRFVLEGLAAGPTRLRCPGFGGRVVCTPWTAL